MKNLALIYGDPAAEPQYGADEFVAMIAGYQEASETYAKENAFIAGQALQPVETATSVRIRDGKATLSDGPFAETKEHLGGFYLLECADLDAAIRYAKMIPSAKYGTVEIRPVMVFDGD